MVQIGEAVCRIDQAVPTPIWQELLVGVEMVCLRVSPVYWGFGVPRGDGSAVIVIPGLLGTDLYLAEMRGWLGRIGYRAYSSHIGLNAECPNLLIRDRLARTIDKARRETGRRVHLVGHSLGGLLALAAASHMPKAVASATTLGSPFRGVAAHPSVMRLVQWVKSDIHARNGENVLPHCYTGQCTCDFLTALVAGKLPAGIRQTAIYTKTDGIVDWRVCKTGNPEVDVEVVATHLGLAFNPAVFEALGRTLAVKKRAVRSRCA
jgi:pimeloyl-ACP methyl ester carboxylesterase